MKKRIRSMGVVVLASLGMLAMGSASAFAQDYPPSPEFDVTCNTAAQPTVCGVVGAEAGEALTASASASPAFYTEELTANAQGEADFGFTVPADVGDRPVTVTVVRANGEAASTQIDPIDPITEVRTGEPVAEEGLLARTGQDTILLGAAGLVLLTGGVLTIRRRKVGSDEHVAA